MREELEFKRILSFERYKVICSELSLDVDVGNFDPFKWIRNKILIGEIIIKLSDNQSKSCSEEVLRDSIMEYLNTQYDFQELKNESYIFKYSIVNNIFDIITDKSKCRLLNNKYSLELICHHYYSEVAMDCEYYEKYINLKLKIGDIHLLNRLSKIMEQIYDKIS